MCEPTIIPRVSNFGSTLGKSTCRLRLRLPVLVDLLRLVVGRAIVVVIFAGFSDSRCWFHGLVKGVGGLLLLRGRRRGKLGPSHNDVTIRLKSHQDTVYDLWVGKGLFRVEGRRREKGGREEALSRSERIVGGMTVMLTAVRRDWGRRRLSAPGAMEGEEDVVVGVGIVTVEITLVTHFGRISSSRPEKQYKVKQAVADQNKSNRQ